MKRVAKNFEYTYGGDTGAGGLCAVMSTVSTTFALVGQTTEFQQASTAAVAEPCVALAVAAVVVLAASSPKPVRTSAKRRSFIKQSPPENPRPPRGAVIQLWLAHQDVSPSVWAMTASAYSSAFSAAQAGPSPVVLVLAFSAAMHSAMTAGSV